MQASSKGSSTSPLLLECWTTSFLLTGCQWSGWTWRSRTRFSGVASNRSCRTYCIWSFLGHKLRFRFIGRPASISSVQLHQCPRPASHHSKQMQSLSRAPSELAGMIRAHSWDYDFRRDLWLGFWQCYFHFFTCIPTQWFCGYVTFFLAYITIICIFFGRKFWGLFQKVMKITSQQDSLACWLRFTKFYTCIARRSVCSDAISLPLKIECKISSRGDLYISCCI